MELIQTLALLAQRVDYGDWDRICTLLTKDHGKLVAMARGARRSRKRYGGTLTLFVIGKATLRRSGTREMLTLERFSCSEDLATPLTKDVVKVAHASYMLELARELWPAGQPEPVSFDLLCEALRVLARQDAPSPALLRSFELQALATAGMDPALERCVQCEQDPGEVPVQFYFSRGGILCHQCAGDPRRNPEYHAGVIPRAKERGGAGRHRAAQLDSARGQPLAQGAFYLLDPLARKTLIELRCSPVAHSVTVSSSCTVARQLRDLMLLLVRQTLGKELRSLAFIAQLSSPQKGSGVDTKE